MKYLTMCLLSVAFLVSCKDDDGNVAPVENEFDYLIVGTYYGECLGNCAFFYKLEGGDLFADMHEIGVPINIQFQTTPLPAADYELAAELLNVPDDITLSNQDVWGCPDCADQGGVYLEIGYDTDLIASYRIDTRNDGLTEDIIAYKDRVLMIVNELEN